MIDPTFIEKKFFDILTKEMNRLSSQNETMSDKEIQKAQKILGKKYKMLNIKTKDIEKIVKTNVIDELSLDNILNVSEMLFQSKYYHHGACAIILIQRRKKHFKNKKTSIQILNRIKLWFKKGLIDSWPYSDSLCLKVIKPILVANKDLETHLLEWQNNSINTWTQRAIIVSFIKFAKENHSPNYWFLFLEQYIYQDKDMIQKACGWFLREFYAVYPQEVELFIRKNHKKIERIIVRTAFEKMEKEKRKKILKELK